jgi:site-specific recombinase XerC
MQHLLAYQQILSKQTSYIEISTEKDTSKHFILSYSSQLEQHMHHLAKKKKKETTEIKRSRKRSCFKTNKTHLRK